jgi:hypothetical protein
MPLIDAMSGHHQWMPLMDAINDNIYDELMDAINDDINNDIITYLLYCTINYFNA